MKPLTPERVLRAEIAQGFVPCPACNGLPVVSPYEQFNDKPCQMCKGQGVVHPAFTCRECGRPAVFQHIETGIVYCGATVCLDELKKDLKVEKKPNIVEAMSAMDSLASYEEYYSTHGMT